MTEAVNLTEEMRRRASEAVAAESVDLSHDGLALEMGEKWDDARHVAAWGRWLFWTGNVWETDETLRHMTLTREFLRRLAEHMDSKAAKRLRSSETVAKVVGLARSNPSQVATVDQWDADPYQLGHPEPEDP